MIMQDPKFSLNPVMTVGQQITEALMTHEKVSTRVARQKALEMLDAVAIRNPERVLDLYPHEVSGGMGQRIMIAMMLIPDPEILIADEPTSALDVSVQAEILNLLTDLRAERHLTYVMVSHDLGVVGHMCGQVAVMQHGEIVEELGVADMRQLKAEHDYTQHLLDSSLRSIR
jgi:ABC-type dipeptide/oligopeptide/nickel transport system ATPase component